MQLKERSKSNILENGSDAWSPGRCFKEYSEDLASHMSYGDATQKYLDCLKSDFQELPQEGGGSTGFPPAACNGCDIGHDDINDLLALMNLTSNSSDQEFFEASIKLAKYIPIMDAAFMDYWNNPANFRNGFNPYYNYNIPKGLRLGIITRYISDNNFHLSISEIDFIKNFIRIIDSPVMHIPGEIADKLFYYTPNNFPLKPSYMWLVDVIVNY